MLELLYKVENSLRELLYKNVDSVQTMYIDYHKPYVSRIWFIDKELDCRIFLHKIEDILYTFREQSDKHKSIGVQHFIGLMNDFK